MSSTATTRNRLEKQGTGDNPNTWGTKLNTTGLDLLDSGMDGMASYALSGTKTLTSVNYAADEARMRFQNITSGTGGTVTIPSVEKFYMVRNGSSGDVIFTTGAGTTATLKAGNIAGIVCDGTNTYLAQITAYGSTLPTSTATPSSGSELTTKTYVDAAILTAALSAEIPDQTGNSGKYLTTNGTTASWGTIDLSSYATTAAVAASYAPLASPTLTGTPLAPTAAADTNTTQVATTAFVIAQAGSATPAAVATAAVVGTSAKYARADHAHALLPWTQIATSTPTATATVTFASIPQTYNDLLLVLAGVSHNNGASQSLGLTISADGITYSTSTMQFEDSGAATVALNGAVLIPRYTGGTGTIMGTVSNTSGDPMIGSTAGTSSSEDRAWKCTGGINAIKVAWSAGDYDAGTLTLYGR